MKEIIKKGSFSLVLMYVVTFLLISISAFITYKTELSDNVINFVIYIIYGAVGLFGGFLLGKMIKRRRGLFGMVIGIVYVLIVLLISFFMGGLAENSANMAINGVICIIFSTIGGIFS